jgi:hypothetical protein
MLPTTFFALAMGLAGHLVQATTIQAPGNYGYEPITWSITVFEDQEPYNLTGTVQEVHAQAVKLNPDFKLNNVSSLDPSNDKRDLPKPTTLMTYNFPKDPTAQCVPSLDGAYYLNRVPGTPTNGPGPGNCGRVSCAYNSAIWWCKFVSSLIQSCDSESAPLTVYRWNRPDYEADTWHLATTRRATLSSPLAGLPMVLH